MTDLTDKTISSMNTADLLQIISRSGGDAERFISLADLQTLLNAATGTQTNKTLTNPVINGIVSGITTIPTLATADVTLSATQAAVNIIVITTAHATNACIAPALAGKTYLVINNDASTDAVFKAVGSTSPISIVKSTASWVYSNGTDYIKVVIA